MTSIDDLQHDLKSVSDSVLGDLSPEERVSMFAKAFGDRAATDDGYADERAEWLRESIPASSHADYREKMLVATGLSRSATYGLHMGYMQYRLVDEKAQKHLLNTLAMPELYGGDGGDAGEDSAVADTLDDLDLEPLNPDKIMDRARQKVDTAATGLYIEYHANKRFANKVLDVDLEEFLALSPSGWIDHVDFGAVLEHAEEKGHITDPTFVDEDGNTEEMPLEDAVETLYDELVRNWTGDLEEDEL